MGGEEVRTNLSTQDEEGSPTTALLTQRIVAPLPFVWCGHNYLVKMCVDQPELPLPMASDPLLLHWFDEHAALWRTSEAAEASSFCVTALPAPVLERLEAATHVLRAEGRHYRLPETNARALCTESIALELRWLLYGELHSLADGLALLTLVQVRAPTHLPVADGFTPWSTSLPSAGVHSAAALDTLLLGSAQASG